MKEQNQVPEQLTVKFKELKDINKYSLDEICEELDYHIIIDGKRYNYVRLVRIPYFNYIDTFSPYGYYYLIDENYNKWINLPLKHRAYRDDEDVLFTRFIVDNIYINDAKHKNVNELLSVFFSSKHTTPLSTFFENKDVHCNMGAARSIDDIILLCKSSYPNCSLQDIVKRLLMVNYDDLFLAPGFCFDIGFPVVRVRRNGFGYSWENPYIRKTFFSKWSWEDFYKLIGIDSYGEYFECVKLLNIRNDDFDENDFFENKRWKIN